ncbi:MAG: hypothetical protein QW241_09105 [Candidatus Bathyarchaeia archaeon]
MDGLRERLEDEVCRDCVLEPTCSDHCYHCEAFNRLLALVKALNGFLREAGDLIAREA